MTTIGWFAAGLVVGLTIARLIIALRQRKAEPESAKLYRSIIEPEPFGTTLYGYPDPRAGRPWVNPALNAFSKTEHQTTNPRIGGSHPPAPEFDTADMMRRGQERQTSGESAATPPTPETLLGGF